MGKQEQSDWQARAEAAEARIAAAICVIEQGYPRTGEPFDECEHGRIKIDDCIGCYDEALLAALYPPHRETPQ